MDMVSSERAQELEAEAKVLMSKYDQFKVVKSEQELERANECAAQMKRIIKALDTERKSMGSGLRDSLSKINAFFNRPINQLKEAVRVPESGAKAYMMAKLRREQEERRKAEEEARRQEEEALQALADAEDDEKANEAAALADEAEARRAEMAKAKSVARSNTGTMGSKATLKDVWKWKVTDIDKVPPEYLLPPEERVRGSMLTAIAKSQHDAVAIPGIEFFNDPTLAHRS